jgi:hypothetical protein
MPRPTPAIASGISVTATVGPTCPGPERPGQECTAPYVGEFVVTDRNGDMVAHFTTDQDGHFMLDLPPGDYQVTPKLDSTGPFPPRGKVDVTVAPGQYADVAIELDTGIR